jgi:hypothetical protein
LHPHLSEIAKRAASDSRQWPICNSASKSAERHLNALARTQFALGFDRSGVGLVGGAGTSGIPKSARPSWGAASFFCAGTATMSERSFTAMLDSEKFFQQQIEECRELARHTVNEDDREFWQQAAERWQAQLRQINQVLPAKKSNVYAHTRRTTGKSRVRS